MNRIEIEIDYNLLADKIAERIGSKASEGRKMTVEQAAIYCNVNPASIRNWLAKGVIRNYGSIGKHLFLESELKPLRKMR